MTDFLQVKDNAKTRAINGSLNNITNPITLSGINTTKFPEVTTGYAITIWDDALYSDPGDDPNMEKALVTEATIDATDGSFILSRPFAKAHPNSPRIALLALAQHVTELQDAINNLEQSNKKIMPYIIALG